MDVRIQETEKGSQIDIHTDRKIAVAVEGEEERIYLPEESDNNTSYYAESYEGLRSTDFGYQLVHEGEISDFEILG
ncbi:hypothetical protein GKQ38_03950 [Candidatus Nanohaloarchaea archaeon]|nr:hypothetical protein GKQ38_03950 [Candidatus Nanohaloarchaea archaeon]